MRSTSRVIGVRKSHVPYTYLDSKAEFRLSIVIHDLSPWTTSHPIEQRSVRRVVIGHLPLPVWARGVTCEQFS